MIGNPKDTVVDMSKFVQFQSSTYNIPIIKDDKVIGVCIEHKNNAYRCEIWNRSVETEISGDTKQITAIILK